MDIHFMKSSIILCGYDFIIVYEFDLLVIFFGVNTTLHLSQTLIGILCLMSSD